MIVERTAPIVAGFFALPSLSPGIEAIPMFASKNCLQFPAFIGLSLFQSGFTFFCPPNNILAKFGIKKAAC